MQIMFLIQSMGPSGAERVMASLANGLTSRGHKIYLRTLNSSMNGSFYQLNPDVEFLQSVDTWEPRGINSWYINTSLIRKIRMDIVKYAPNIILAFRDQVNILAILAAARTNLPVVVSERSDPSITPLPLFWRLCRMATYPFATTVVVQSREVRDWFPSWIQRKVTVIPNPISRPRQDPNNVPNTASKRMRMLAVGRLAHQKGFDVLLQAFASLETRFPDWDLEIRGEGPERSFLEGLREHFGLQNRVFFPGVTSDIDDSYRHSDLFVMSSRFEGFPNALCEAMAHGLPVVTTSCAGAVRDFIQQGLNGFLVPAEDPLALSEALAALMQDPNLRQLIGRQARAVVQDFDKELVLNQWEACLDRAFRERSS